MHLISREELIDFEITAVSKKGVSRRVLQLRPRWMMDGDAYGVSRINETRIDEGGRGEDDRGRESDLKLMSLSRLGRVRVACHTSNA